MGNLYSTTQITSIEEMANSEALMELYLINDHVADVLAGKGIKVAKTLVGNFMTSLDMEGFSITLLKLDDELKALLNAPADTPAFRQF